MWEAVACRVTAWSQSPWAVLGVPLGCAVWLWHGWDEARLGTVLGAAGITYAQLVLRGQARDQARGERMQRELVRAVPEADEHVADD